MAENDQDRLIPDDPPEAAAARHSAADDWQEQRGMGAEEPGAEGSAGRGQELLMPGAVLVDLDGAPTDRNELGKETLIPVSGMVRLSSRELEVIDHPAFQRLFEIYQLGQVYTVYRGATHMRGEHAIGTLYVAQLMIDATLRNRAREPVEPSEHWQRAPQLSETEIALVRLGALLHDIGHLPAGHTLEDELGLLGRHDGDERINLILDRPSWHGRANQPLRALLDDRYAAEAADAAQRGEDGQVLTPSELLIRLISRDHKDDTPTLGTSFRLGVCRDLIGNTICADLIDYLYRDLLHLGKPREFDPRLLEYLEILTRQREVTAREDRLVINLRGTPRPRPDAVTAIIDLLESRYQLSEVALFHRVKLAAAGMLERLIAEYRDSFDTPELQRSALEDLLPELIECSDAEMLKLFEQKLLERRSEQNAGRIGGAVDLARRLRVRRLHRQLHVLYEDDIGGPEVAAEIATRFSGDPDLEGGARRADVRRAATDRLRTVRALEGDFGLSPGEIVMYCPPLQMNTKIAEVGIFVRGIVDSLARLDERNPRISGGHLRAQQERFRRLWRVAFAIDKDAYGRLEAAGTLESLIWTIDDAVLWIPAGFEDQPVDAVRRIAETMVRLEDSPWFGHEVVEPALNREQPSIEYVGGAPSVSSFMGSKPKATARRSRGTARGSSK
jgi:uncharacterized protein